MSLGPIPTTAARPSRSGVAEWLTPARGWWLGIALLAVALIYKTFFLQSLWALGGQELLSSAAVYFLSSLVGVAVPLGASFVVASVLAARIRRIGFSSPTAVTIARADEPRLPPRLSPRLAVLVGTAMIVIALIDESLMLVQYLPQQPSIERDIAHLLTPLIAFLLPIGVALIPAGWLLGQLDNRIARRPGKQL
jgi:hypothetical protein